MTPVAELSELHAALLQAGVTLAIAVLCAFLYRTYRREYFAWLAVAWSAYALRLGCIVAFLTVGAPAWLFAHQILTGWTAIALLWSALTFARPREWRWWYPGVLAFPVLWSWVAIYQLDNFMLAAGPAVLFLSLATFWTGIVFWRHWRLTGSRGAALLTGVFVVWALHHLDYPLLRARGAWNPWGYYLDILFVLATSIGIVILVLEQTDRDLRALLALSGERPAGGARADNIDHLFARLNSSLAARTRELEQLSDHVVQQHEDMRRNVSRELHDQSAQVWAAVKLQLGALKEEVPPALAPRMDRVLSLVDDGMRSIRTVTEHLRPPILDELGLLPALRALVRTFAEQSGLRIRFDAPAALPAVSRDAGLALYRALQEALANVVRHAQATSVTVRLEVQQDELTLAVQDDGRGFPAPTDAAGLVSGVGLTGMRERIAALHGSLTLNGESGALVTVRLPIGRT